MTLPPILVTGGTGTLGQQVVSRPGEAGREVRVLSRRSRERPRPGTGATLGHRSWPDFPAGKPAEERSADEKPTHEKSADKRPAAG